MVTMYEPRKMAIPERHPEHEEFWAAAREGKLLIKKCEDCNEYHYYPRVLCPYCNSDRTIWTEASGKGVIYTFSVMRKGTPYAIAFVELDEGPRLMTNIVDCDFDQLQINQEVMVIFKQTGDIENVGASVPCFTPLKDR